MPTMVGNTFRTLNNKRAGMLASGAQAMLLDFLTPQYVSGSKTLATLPEVPGYGYARAGAMSVPDSNGGITDVAINALPLNGFGVHSYDVANNRLIRSKEFSAAGWTATGNTGVNPVVTADQIAAPDGTATADKIVFSAVSGAGKVSNVLRSFTSRNGTQMASIYMRGDVGGEQLYIWLLNGTTYIKAARITLTTGWQRILLPATLNGAVWSFAIGCDLRDLTQVTTAACTVYVWQAQVLDGTFPDGGPLVPTAAAAMTTFTPNFKAGLQSGNYNATFTFDDDSTQVVALALAANLFVMPTYPTVLNRPRVKKVRLVLT